MSHFFIGPSLKEKSETLKAPHNKSFYLCDLVMPPLWLTYVGGQVGREEQLLDKPWDKSVMLLVTPLGNIIGNTLRIRGNIKTMHIKATSRGRTNKIYLKFDGTLAISPPIFAQGSNRKCCKRSHCVKGSESHRWNLTQKKKLPRFIAKFA